MKTQINYNGIEQYVHLKKVFNNITEWIVKKLNLNLENLGIIFTTDVYLKQLHKNYFNLNTKTDVITFNFGEIHEPIEGEIYISVERAIAQSKQYKIEPEIEICRLLIHGCLHLAGYDDQNQNDFVEMKKVEDKLVDEIVNLFKDKLLVELN